MIQSDSKSFQIHHPEVLHDLASTRTLIEIIVGTIRSRNLAKQVFGLIQKGDEMGVSLRPLGQTLGHQVFVGTDGSERGQQIIRVFHGSENELSGGKIEPSCLSSFIVAIQSQNKIVLACFQLAFLQHRSRSQDASNATLNQFTRLGRLQLLAYSHLVTASEQFSEVTLRRMERDACHRHIVPLGQGDAKQGRPPFRILLEHLVKVSQSEEKQSLRSQARPSLPVLLHHGSVFFTLCHP